MPPSPVSGAPAIPRIGVVIVNYNGREDLERCLGAIARSTWQPAATVVVDNASTDGSAALVERGFPSVAVLSVRENAGFPAGANAGIRWCLAAGHDAVVLLNPDATVEPRALAELAAAGAAHPRSLVGAMLVRDADPTAACTAGTSISWWRGRTVGQAGVEPGAAGRDRPVDALSGCGLLIPRGAFEAVGPFDEDYFLYFEDSDLSVRARAAGWELWIAPRAVIRHREGAATGGRGAPLAMYYFIRNRRRFVRKFRRGRVIYAPFLAYEACDVAARVALAAARGRMGLARAIGLGFVDGWRERTGNTWR
jgi:GT2 family glycosyltransferase